MWWSAVNHTETHTQIQFLVKRKIPILVAWSYMNWLHKEPSFHRRVKLRSLHCMFAFAPLHNVDKKPDPIMIKPLRIYVNLQYWQRKGVSSTQNKKSETFLETVFEYFISWEYFFIFLLHFFVAFSIFRWEKKRVLGLIDIQEGTIWQFVWITL